MSNTRPTTAYDLRPHTLPSHSEHHDISRPSPTWRRRTLRLLRAQYQWKKSTHAAGEITEVSHLLSSTPKIWALLTHLNFISIRYLFNANTVTNNRDWLGIRQKTERRRGWMRKDRCGMIMIYYDAGAISPRWWCIEHDKDSGVQTHGYTHGVSKRELMLMHRSTTAITHGYLHMHRIK